MFWKDNLLIMNVRGERTYRVCASRFTAKRLFNRFREIYKGQSRTCGAMITDRGVACVARWGRQ